MTSNSFQPVKDDSFMQYFWDLASEQLVLRQTAAKSLVECVRSKKNQQEYLDYSISRLFRGLSSPRDCARQGFSVALSVLLTEFPLTVEKAVKLLDEHTQVRVGRCGVSFFNFVIC